MGRGGSSPTGFAIGIILGPIIAVQKMAGIIGVDLTAESMGMQEPDYAFSPASVGQRLDSLEICEVKRSSSQVDQEEVVCAVCQCAFEDEEQGFVLRGCQHKFHVQCLSPWLERRHTCPCCRESLGSTPLRSSRPTVSIAELREEDVPAEASPGPETSEIEDCGHEASCEVKGGRPDLNEYSGAGKAFEKNNLELEPMCLSLTKERTSY
ncbi:hypothetical protein GUITHDRAFT_110162 [Guillardia theta CCMP2712]|uniref:RING-type domain-containing protein n=1 Tax=Guillardia theta (strain CCMP2712) TaxID=905079 RepID=L1J5B5_GUITC|nr:hypothetical protein GUITHDRAFT_110162 [Guillardia theta CCMP2712]EKX43706.1 hypothetical protein GUITHDRAFT_110162 [Guillardia theta CCMP2712]|eukprot:XP_005830686.1 hypothetical protein GUITHDRAFT_110162 [Guillardia theta CCMP2712]